MSMEQPMTGFIGGKMSAGELAKHLADGKRPIGMSCSGWMKKSDLPNSISFAPLSNCNVWIDLPTDNLEIEILGEEVCENHAHVKILLHFGANSNQHTISVRQLIHAMQKLAATNLKLLSHLAGKRTGVQLDGGMPRQHGCWINVDTGDEWCTRG